ncbi:ATP-binding protein (plasmid) [Streptomyces sp. CA-142005]|uniref:ATP-binding protein n=1 Tax=Streptomyces sp. CA-142005 TaxID=3240052 RepID=UPI003D8A7A0E
MPVSGRASSRGNAILSPGLVAVWATSVVVIARRRNSLSRIPGRWPRVREMIVMDGPVVEMVSDRVEVWIEGGHCLSRARTACCSLAGNAGWLPEAQEDLALIVSELVTNACCYSSGPCRLSLEMSAGAAVVEVWDSNPHIPAVPARSRAPLSDAVPTSGGYGLGIVACLSARLDFFAQESGGKTARAVVAL